MKQLEAGDKITPKRDQQQVDANEKCMVVKTRLNSEREIVYHCSSIDKSGGFKIKHKRLKNEISNGNVQLLRTSSSRNS